MSASQYSMLVCTDDVGGAAVVVGAVVVAVVGGAVLIVVEEEDEAEEDEEEEEEGGAPFGISSGRRCSCGGWPCTSGTVGATVPASAQPAGVVSRGGDCRDGDCADGNGNKSIRPDSGPYPRVNGGESGAGEPISNNELRGDGINATCLSEMGCDAPGEGGVALHRNDEPKGGATSDVRLLQPG